jgi:SAM-dependent methyltransferase
MAVLRQSPHEQARERSLMALAPPRARRVLDVGTRDGHFARLLADRGAEVVALDLDQPTIDHPLVQSVKGDASALPFPDGSFDFVLCAEVLEHVPSPALEQACGEMARVCSGHVLLGVPYRQDLRMHRTLCVSCGRVNPPWAHVNSFDEQRLLSLMPGWHLGRKELIGTAEPGTNAVAEWLMDRAGHPYGTYVQDEPCLHCGALLRVPTIRTLAQRAFAKAGVLARRVGRMGRRPHASWIHALFTHPRLSDTR